MNLRRRARGHQADDLLPPPPPPITVLEHEDSADWLAMGPTIGSVSAPPPLPYDVGRVAWTQPVSLNADLADLTEQEQPVSFTRVPDTDRVVPLTAADPIIRKLSRSGRADVMEAIAEVIDPVDVDTIDGTTVTYPTAHIGACAHVLRVLAPRERRS